MAGQGKTAMVRPIFFTLGTFIQLLSAFCLIPVDSSELGNNPSKPNTPVFYDVLIPVCSLEES
jgi:hypothetical protein